MTRPFHPQSLTTYNPQRWYITHSGHSSLPAAIRAAKRLRAARVVDVLRKTVEWERGA